jgi:hypothetical protein
MGNAEIDKFIDRFEKSGGRDKLFLLYARAISSLLPKTPARERKDYLPSYLVKSREKADGIQKTKGQTTYYTTYKPI